LFPEKTAGYTCSAADWGIGGSV